jgi:hypothetical protein
MPPTNESKLIVVNLDFLEPLPLTSPSSVATPPVALISTVLAPALESKDSRLHSTLISDRHNSELSIMCMAMAVMVGIARRILTTMTPPPAFTTLQLHNHAWAEFAPVTPVFLFVGFSTCNTQGVSILLPAMCPSVRIPKIDQGSVVVGMPTVEEHPAELVHIKAM